MRSSLKAWVFVNALLVSSVSWATDFNPFPELLTESLYRKDDVCDHARTHHPHKKLALILLKTHFCDVGTGVCMGSLRTVADPTNVFLRDHFATYHTRFFSQDLVDGHSMIQLEYKDSANLIRNEWDKKDLDPEVLVLNLKDCKILGRKYLKSTGLILFGPRSKERYVALRNLLLSISKVSSVLNIKKKNTILLDSELNESQLLESASPEPTPSQIYHLLNTQSLPDRLGKAEVIETEELDPDDVKKVLSGSDGKGNLFYFSKDGTTCSSCAPLKAKP